MKVLKAPRCRAPDLDSSLLSQRVVIKFLIVISLSQLCIVYQARRDKTNYGDRRKPTPVTNTRFLQRGQPFTNSTLNPIFIICLIKLF